MKFTAWKNAKYNFKEEEDKIIDCLIKLKWEFENEYILPSDLRVLHNEFEDLYGGKIITNSDDKDASMMNTEYYELEKDFLKKYYNIFEVTYINTLREIEYELYSKIDMEKRGIGFEIDVLDEVEEALNDSKYFTLIGYNESENNIDDYRANFFINSPIFENYIDLIKVYRNLSGQNIITGFPDNLFPYYIYRILSEAKDELKIKINKVFKSTVNKSELEYIYAYKKTEFIKEKLSESSIEFLKEQYMYNLFSKINYSAKLKCPKNDSLLDLEVKEIEKILNFDKEFYYYSQYFFKLKFFNKMVLDYDDVVAMENVNVVNKLDFLYDSLIFADSAIINNNLFIEKEIVKKISEVDNFKLKKDLVKLYKVGNKDLILDVINNIHHYKETIKSYVGERIKFDICKGFINTDEQTLLNIKSLINSEIENFKDYVFDSDAMVIDLVESIFDKWEQQKDTEEKMIFLEVFGNYIKLFKKMT